MNSIVIARYNESLDWIVQIPSEFEIFIYNKGEKVTAPHLLQKAHHIIDRPNIGRESETYIYHMLTNLKAGNGFTVFAQGDPFEHSPDFLKILAVSHEWDDIQPMTWQWRGDHNIPPAILLNAYERELKGRLRVRPERFSLMTWNPAGFFDQGAYQTSVDYRRLNGELPEGTNIAAHFLRLCQLDAIADQAQAHQFGVFGYGAIFGVRNDLVRQVPVESRKRLLAASMGTMNYGYILERMWLHLFGADFETPAPARAVASRELPVRPATPPVATTLSASAAAATVATQAAGDWQEIRIPAAQPSQNAVSSEAGAARVVSRPKRLFISTGYFATAVAAAIAASRSVNCDDHMLIVNDRQNAKGNLHWAYHMHDQWQSVHVATHEQYYEDRSNFKNLFGVEFDEVYSSHLTQAGYVREKFPARRYFFFEEGITSYALANELGNEHTRFYALAPKFLENKSVLSLPIDLDALRHKFEMSISCYDIPVFDHPRNAILLAAGLPPDYTGSRLDSLASCEAAARALIASGFKVWLRPHPRVDIADIFQTSGLAAVGVSLLETNSPLIEPVIMRNRDRISAVVSVYSSLLVHSQALFGVPAFSLPGKMLDEQQAKWKAMQDLVVPDLQQLLHPNPDRILDVPSALHSFIGGGHTGPRRASV